MELISIEQELIWGAILRLSFSSWYTFYVVNLKKSLSDTLFYRGAVKVTFKSE